MDRQETNSRNSGAAAPLRDDVGLPREAYALLAQANLLRMRGCWEEAVQNCMAALRLAPDSAAAQSLLGDIYENQGRVDDAVQWYHMALDANPDSPADRLKLDRLLQRRQPSSRAARPLPVAITEAEPVPPPAGAQPPVSLREGLRRRLQDPEAALRYGAAAAALLVCLLVVLAYASVHRRAALATLGLAPDQEVRLQPVVVPPGPVPAGTPDGGRHDAAEAAVLGVLRGSADLSAQGVTVEDVQFDPRTSQVTLTVAGGGLSRASILRGALGAVQATAAASPSAAAFTVRCLSSESSGGDSLLFVGDATRSALPASGVTPGDAQVQALFTDPWWSPSAPN